MFNLVAKRKRLIQVVLALIIIPFAFFGLESYTRSMRGADDVARVEGMSISQREFSEELRQQQDRLRAVLGRGVDPALLDAPEMRRGLLESLITQRLIAAEAARGNLTLSKDQVIELVTRAPEFQEGGKFSPRLYEEYLRTRSLSDEGNVAQLQYRVPVSRLAESVLGTAIGSRTVAERVAALQGQRREIAEARFPAEAFLAQAKPGEEQLKAYFDAHAEEFRVPERVRADYVVLSAAELGREAPVSEEELKAAYQARAGQYRVEEQRRASHILVKTREEAEKLVAEARKSPERFAELAKRHSLDTGSAEKGGDLGLFSRGMMVKPFEDAAFAMKQGEIAGPVQSEFGFHVIRLTGVQPGSSRPLEDVRKELSAELARQKGARKFAEAAETFSNMVYEQPDSLQPVAERLRLKIVRSDWIARGGAPDLGPVGHPKVVAALFSQDAIQAKRNTDAIEVAQGVLVSARVAEHQSATQRKFEDVRADIERKVRREEAAKRAREEGAARLAELAKGGEAGLKWSSPRIVARRDQAALPAEALRKVFAADAAKLPAHVGVALGDDGYAIYRVLRVLEAEARTDEQRKADLAAAERQVGAEQFDAWVASLRSRGKIEINQANLEKR